jgi:hypothetical protein
MLDQVETQEDIAGKQRFSEHNRFATVFMRRIVTGQSGRETVPFTELDQLFFAPRPGVRHEPR